MNINLTNRVVRSDIPLTAPVEKELVMANLDTGKYYAFNDIAAVIWSSLEKETTVQELCLKLQDAYDVPSQKCETEVLAFLNRLHERKLVDIVK